MSEQDSQDLYFLPSGIYPLTRPWWQFWKPQGTFQVARNCGYTHVAFFSHHGVATSLHVYQDGSFSNANTFDSWRRPMDHSLSASETQKFISWTLNTLPELTKCAHTP